MKFPFHSGLAGLAGLLLCLGIGRAASAMDVTLDVQPKLLNLGETATATLTFHGTRSAPGIELPPLDGVQITAAGQRTEIINGNSRISQAFNLFPQRPGTFTLGPYGFEMQGETINIPAATFEVRAPDGQNQANTNGMIFARMDLPRTSPTIHQVFDITLNLYFLPSIQLTPQISLIGGFPESGFILGNFEELQTIREEVDGQIYTLRRFRTRARALTAGTFTLEPALRVNVVDQNARNSSRDPFFDGFFNSPFNQTPSTPMKVSAPPCSLTIDPIPQEGRPADFSGAVGRFRLTVDVRPRDLKVGEPITVKIDLQGSGNIASIIPPSYADTDLYKAYESRQVGDIPDPSAERGSKTFEQVVIPRTDSLTELPALKFSYFDPDTRRYETATAGPFPLTVHPSENGSDAMLLQIPGGAINGGHALVLGSDIIYLKPAPNRWLSTSGDAVHRGLKIAGLVLPPLVLLGLFIATRRRNRLASDVALARRQEAPKSARAQLRKAEAALKQNPTAAGVFTPLTAAAMDYFGHRLNLPPGAVGASLILEKLQAVEADPAMRDQWKDFFELSDRIHYSSASDLSKSELTGWVSTLTALLRQTERIRL